MNVTTDNLDVAVDDFEKHLDAAAFVALDLEMTGISLAAHKESMIDTPSQRYENMRVVASTFKIIQVGLTLFTHAPPSSDNDAAADYIARTYNVYVFAEQGTLTMDGSAIAFLKKHKMDFNAWMYTGVPYVDAPAEEKLRAKYDPPPPASIDAAATAATVMAMPATPAKSTSGSPASPPQTPAPPSSAAKQPSGGGVVVTRPDDVLYVESALKQIADWWSNSAAAAAAVATEQNGDGAAVDSDNASAAADECALRGCNGFLRKYLYQVGAITRCRFCQLLLALPLLPHTHSLFLPSFLSSFVPYHTLTLSFFLLSSLPSFRTLP
jgi:hypothetical protein